MTNREYIEKEVLNLLDDAKKHTRVYSDHAQAVALLIPLILEAYDKGVLKEFLLAEKLPPTVVKK